MKRMPYEIKQKLRQLEKACQRAKYLEIEVGNMIESYGVDCDYLNACCDPYEKLPSTEALAYITNSEGGVEDNINLIEKVFLWHFNNKED